MENLEATATETSVDNQTTPEPTATETATETPSTEQKAEGSETSPETKPEFSDPNMQSQFTKRMTEIKAKEQEYETYKKDAEYYRQLKQDQEAVKILQDYYSSKNQPKPVAKPVEVPPITEQEFLEATTDPAKFQALVDKRASALVDKALAEKLAPLEQKLGTTTAEIEQGKQLAAINEFAAQHPDFWDLDNGGKGEIEGYLKVLEPNQTISFNKKLEMAYKLAKLPTLEKEAIAKAHKVVEQKKSASSDKSAGDNSKYKKSDNRTMEQLLIDEANKLTWESK